jgi:hypothetical protein
MSDSPQDKGGPDPSNDANSYWQTACSASTPSAGG